MLLPINIYIRETAEQDNELIALSLFFNNQEKESEDLTTASVFGTAKATQEADNVLILQDRRLTSVRGRKYIQVNLNMHAFTF